MQKYSKMLDEVFRDYWRRPVQEVRDAISQATEDFSNAGFFSVLAFETYYVAYANQLIGECEIDRIRKILNGKAVDSDLQEYKNNIQRSLDLFDMIPIFEGDVGDEECDRRLRQRINDMREFATQFQPFGNLCEAWIEANIREKYRSGERNSTG